MPWIRRNFFSLFAAIAGVTLIVANRGALLEAATYDVPYVPTPQEVVDEMLKVARVGPDDFVMDLGSGDGRIVLTAVRKYGARGMGVDLNPNHIVNSNRTAQEEGIADRATFVNANLFDTDISQATVLTMYLLPDVNLRLRPRILTELKPGTRVVSHEFDMGGWKPDRKLQVPPGLGHTIYYWVVPANVEGVWTAAAEAGQPMQLSINQKFQEVRGVARVADRDTVLSNARVDGDRISFFVNQEAQGGEGRQRFEGRVDGNTMEGVIVSDKAGRQPVTLTRTGDAGSSE